MPLKPASPASWPIWVSSASNCVDKGRLDRGVGRLSGLADQRLRRLHQLGDRRDAVVRRLNGIDGVRHRVEQAAQVVGAVVEALRREEVDRVVEGRIDPLAGGEPGLGLRDQVEVCCNCSRFDRTPAERTMSDILRTFLV